MTAGLPGTGIGGLYYLLLVFWMPVRELYMLARGKSSVRNWRAIAFFLSMTGGIIVSTWGLAWVLSQIVRMFGYVPSNGQAYRVMGGMAIVMSMGSLVAVLTAVQGLRLYFRWHDASRRTTVRTAADLFPGGAINTGKAFHGQLDQTGRTV